MCSLKLITRETNLIEKVQKSYIWSFEDATIFKVSQKLQFKNFERIQMESKLDYWNYISIVKFKNI